MDTFYWPFHAHLLMDHLLEDLIWPQIHLIAFASELLRVQSVLLHLDGQGEQVIVALGPERKRERTPSLISRTFLEQLRTHIVFAFCHVSPQT